MFCDGKCLNKKKRCGLFMEARMEERLTGKIETIEKCVFQFLLESQHRNEELLGRIVKELNQNKNRKMEADHKLSSIVGHGMTGLMHAFTGDKAKVENAFKVLKSLSERKLPLENKK